MVYTKPSVVYADDTATSVASDDLSVIPRVYAVGFDLLFQLFVPDIFNLLASGTRRTTAMVANIKFGNFD